MKNKKWFKIISIIAIITIFLFSGYVVLADTGFDIDYDFGGGSIPYNKVFIMIFFIVIGLTILIDVIRKNTGKGREEDQKNIKSNDSTTDCIVWYDDVESIIPGFNKKEFNKLACEMYVKLQEAWMNFDYETIRSLTTDDLYNSYKTMLESLEKKNQKNIIENIKIYSCIFTNVKNENGKYSIEAKFDLAMTDYIVNKGSTTIARGINTRLSVECVVTFVSTEKKSESKCPVCGAPISKKKHSDKCKFCGNTIVKDNYSWLIAKKKVTKQKTIGDF